MRKGITKKLVLAGTLLLTGISSALAVTTPASGSFAYDVYDITVNKLLKGPAGFVAGCGSIIYGAVSLVMGRILPAVLGVLGGALLIKADAITESLGLLF